jgi:hypothetical protein
MRTWLVVVVLALSELGLDSATGPLDITAAAVDYSAAVENVDAGALTIDGNNFGDVAKSARLYTFELAIESWTNQQIVARLPLGVTKGATYRLTVSRGTGVGEQDSFEVALPPPR